MWSFLQLIYWVATFCSLKLILLDIVSLFLNALVCGTGTRVKRFIVAVLVCIEADSQKHSVYASHLVNGPVLWRDAWNCMALYPCYDTGFDLISHCCNLIMNSLDAIDLGLPSCVTICFHNHAFNVFLQYGPALGGCTEQDVNLLYNTKFGSPVWSVVT